MPDRKRELREKSTDRRVLMVAAIVVAAVLVLFLLFDLRFRTASDNTAGGPDPNFSAPQETEETAPTTQN